MKKTEKLIVVLLLANLALAGALRLFFPSGSPAALPETPVATSPVEVVTRSPEHDTAPTVEVTVVKIEPKDPERELREWAMRNPRAALDWAAQEPPGESRDIVLETACYETANTNPAEAIALAEKFSLTNTGILENLTQQWAQQDLRAACAWVKSKPEGGERDKLAARVGFVWSSSQPAAAAQFVVKEIPPGSAQTEAAISILHQWALRDFNGAVAWVEQFPESEIRERAINELTGIRNYMSLSAAQE